jgi:serine/threonine protein kinase
VRPEQWGRIDALFQKAIECPPEERAVLLDRECSGDPSLRKEVESLIRFTDETGETSFRAEFLQGVAEAIHQEENGTPASSLVSLIGKQISHYQVLSLLGTGGMGSVFLARDMTLHRQVAFKVLDRSRDEATSRARLLREARNAAALNHPNICTIHEVGEEDGTAFIAMEYVEGRSLREHLDHGPPQLEDAVRYGIHASEAWHTRTITA